MGHQQPRSTPNPPQPGQGLAKQRYHNPTTTTAGPAPVWLLASRMGGGRSACPESCLVWSWHWHLHTRADCSLSMSAKSPGREAIKRRRCSRSSRKLKRKGFLLPDCAGNRQGAALPVHRRRSGVSAVCATSTSGLEICCFAA